MSDKSKSDYSKLWRPSGIGCYLSIFSRDQLVEDSDKFNRDRGVRQPRSASSEGNADELEVNSPVNR